MFPKLQASIYDIIPTSAAITGYDILPTTNVITGYDILPTIYAINGYDILPTTAVTGYATGLRNLSAN